MIPHRTLDMTVYDVAIIGAGTMGHGLALQLARTGQTATLVDHRESNLQRARAELHDAAEFLVDEGLASIDPDSVVEAVAFTTDQADGVSGADVVLETVSEDLAVKHEVFAAAVDAAPDDAILATNTSGLRISDIADGIQEHADRVVGCHWWNPPYLMPLVEVISGERTSTSTVEDTMDFVREVGRDPIRVNADVPGFVWNRIQFAVLREAMHIVEAGIASLEDVDRAVRDGYALRTATVGPFETVDLSGLDLFRSIAEELYPDLCNDAAPSALFREYIEAGRNGVNEGAGFYDYDRSPAAVVRHRDERIAAIRRSLGDQTG